jgi:hypothetical protein
MAQQFPQVGQQIRETKVLSKETEGELKRGIEAYKSSERATRESRHG